jgi:hypothetical protein
MTFFAPGLAEEGASLDMLVLGRRVPARIVAPCRYDTGSQRLKA